MGATRDLEGEAGPQKRQKRATQPSPAPSLRCQICEEFRAISRKIYEKPNSIEELAELREWMKGIPEKLVGLEVRWARGTRDWCPGAWVDWKSGGHLGD